MSKNLVSLSRRKGLANNLFERIVETGTARPDLHQNLSKEYLIGEAMTLGAASFYDLLSADNEGKKAFVCDGSACLCAGTQDEVVDKLKQHFDESEIGTITCLGRCHENRAFHYQGQNYSGTAIDNIDDILGNGQAPWPDRYHVESLLDPPILTGAFIGIDDYYAGLKTALIDRSPDEILAHVKNSKLRGRGGAGFPTGMKWAACKQAPGEKKYIVCNADEGDPGAYIDRYLMEHQPHSVLFGMLAAGRVVGADEGVLYIRAEYPESIVRIGEAIRELGDSDYCGESICGTDFAFRFKVIVGAGAYICGEETALLASIEGRRPEVNVRPPYPTTEGLYGMPTVVNNVESFASLNHILSNGGDAFARLGTTESTGTKLLSLDGLFNRPGLYEVPMGTPLAAVIQELGQGFRRPVKALHIGGPLGGLVPRQKFDALTIDFESFRDAGFLLGHGSVVSIPEDLPIVRYMEHIFDFCAYESCGKCFPCRLGSTRGKELLQGSMDGGKPIDRTLFNDLIEAMELGSLCAHGGGIPLPIKNSLEYFDKELEPYFCN